MHTPDSIPTWEESRDAVDASRATSLHHFIYDNEPVGEHQTYAFRLGLMYALNEAIRNARNAG